MGQIPPKQPAVRIATPKLAFSMLISVSIDVVMEIVF